MPKIYHNTEGALTLPGGWTWTTEPNAAGDEYAGEENVLGLFAGGWCIIGVQASVTQTDLSEIEFPPVDLISPGRFGIILLNRFFGFWQDPDAAEYRL